MGKSKNIIAVVIVAIIGTLIFWKRDLIKEKFGIGAKPKTGESPAQNINPPSIPSIPSSSGSSSSGSNCDSFPFKLGCSGGNVKLVQTTLNKKYNAGIAVDGVFGPATEKALENAGFGKELKLSEYMKFMFKQN